jgi:arylsulfatase
MEGTSLVPAFANKPIQREALYWEHEGNAAVRVGDHKLVRKGGGGTWELYDLVKDRTELNDLAGQMPDKVKELAAKWDAWAERCHVREKGQAAGGGPNAAPRKKKGKA